MNNGLRIIAICLAASFFAAGCAHRSEVQTGVFEKVAAAQADHGSNVCLLDPAAYAAEKAEAVPAAEAGGLPAVEIPETSHDFGKVSEEQELVHTFSVRNVGTSILNIRKVVPG